MEIGGVDGQRFETVEAAADPDVLYTFMPPSLLARLGVRPHRKMTFMQPDKQRG